MQLRHLIIPAMLSGILSIGIALALYDLLTRQRAAQRLMAGHSDKSKPSKVAFLSAPHIIYLLPSLFVDAKKGGNNTVFSRLLEFGRDILALDNTFVSAGYRSSRPLWALEIFASSFLWAILLQWGWLLGLALQGPIPSTGLRFLVQILVIGGPAAGVGVLLIKRLSQARYTLSRDGIECRPIFRNNFFIPWQAVSSVKLIGYREYELAWNSQTTRIRNMFDDNAYLPHLILAHLNENAALDQHFAFRRECWFDRTRLEG